MKFTEKLSLLKSSKAGTQSVLLILTVLFLGLFFFILNRLYPAYLDDWFYFFNYSNGEPIRSFCDIIEGQYEHYFTWGGRNVVHTIAQFLLWIGSFWSNVLNTLVYLLFVLLIYFIANKNNKVNISTFILITILIWFTLPTFSQNILWITGSANYLWGCLIVMGFIYPFISYYYTQRKKQGIVRNISFLLIGIVAGWTNENVAAAMIFLIIGLIILLKVRKIAIPLWMIFGFAGAVIGFAIMVLAPGNYERRAHELWVVHHMKEITPSFYFYRFVTVAKLSYAYLLYPVIIYAASLVLYWKKGIEDKKKETLYLSLLFFLSSVIATLAMSGSPIFPERAWFGIIILLIVAIVILYANLDFSSSILKATNYAIFTILLSVFIISGFISYSDLKAFRDTTDRRERLIKEEIEKGKKDIIITDVLFEEKESALMVLNLQDWLIHEREGWAERYGKYHGVKSIRINEHVKESEELK